MVLPDNWIDVFPPDLKELILVAGALADDSRVRLTFVGGAVRDFLLDRPVVDIDLMSEHPVKPFVVSLSKKIKGELISHERFFTFSIILSSRRKIDVVTAREEAYPTPAKLPEVTPSTIEKDLKRRDFTINAMACGLNQSNWGQVIDPYGGQKDMKAKCVRALHNKSFQDDPTRLFRAARFAGRLGFNIDSETEKNILSAIQEGIPRLLSPVRLCHEFELILKEKDPFPVMELLKMWGALELIHPKWKGPEVGSLKFKSPPVLTERLVEWFGRWGRVQAQAMMTDLAFKKSVKAEVLSKLVQSPTTS